MAEYIKRDDVLTKIDEFVKLNEKYGFSIENINVKTWMYITI